MTTTPITTDRNNEHDHVQISTTGIGPKARNDKVLITSRDGDIWLTTIDYAGKSAAVNIDVDTLRELINATQNDIIGE